MKLLTLFLAFCATTALAQTPSDGTGAYATHHYRDLFAEAGQFDALTGGGTWLDRPELLVLDHGPEYPSPSLPIGPTMTHAPRA